MSTNTKHIARRSKLTKGNTTYLKDNNRFSLKEKNDRKQRKKLRTHTQKVKPCTAVVFNSLKREHTKLINLSY